MKYIFHEDIFSHLFCLVYLCLVLNKTTTDTSRVYPLPNNVCSTARLATRPHALHPCACQTRGCHFNSVLPPSNCRVCGTWREGHGGGAVGSVGVLRTQLCHLRAGFQQCKSFVEMGTVRCCPLEHNTLSHVDCAPGAGAEDCITNVRRLWCAELVSLPRRRPTRRRASPTPLFPLTVAGCQLG